MAGVRGLRHLLDGDWFSWRSKDTLCMACLQSFCTGSCNGHRQAHHPDDVTHLAMITDYDGSPVIRIDHIGGLPINWDYIQRVGSGSVKSIPLIPMAGTARLKGTCSYCQDYCTHSARYCSLSCKLELVPGGAEAEALVDLANSYHETHRRDRFCTQCRESFCQDCCPEHDDHHWKPVQVIPIANLPDGRPAIELEDLPHDVTDGVQEIALGWNHSYCLIRPSPDGDDEDTGPRNCTNWRCTNKIFEDAVYCSLKCKHVD